MSSDDLLSSFQSLKTHPTVWTPEGIKVTLNITLDACIVPLGSGGARVDFASLVVLDDFFGEDERSSLLEFLTEPGESSTCMELYSCHVHLLLALLHRLVSRRDSCIV